MRRNKKHKLQQLSLNHRPRERRYDETENNRYTHRHYGRHEHDLLNPGFENEGTESNYLRFNEEFDKYSRNTSPKAIKQQNDYALQRHSEEQNHRRERHNHGLRNENRSFTETQHRRRNRERDEHMEYYQQQKNMYGAEPEFSNPSRYGEHHDNNYPYYGQALPDSYHDGFHEESPFVMSEEALRHGRGIHRKKTTGNKARMKAKQKRKPVAKRKKSVVKKDRTLKNSPASKTKKPAKKRSKRVSAKKKSAKKITAKAKRKSATMNQKTAANAVKNKTGRTRKTITKNAGMKKAKSAHPVKRRIPVSAKRTTKNNRSRKKQLHQKRLKERENYAIRIGDELYAAGFENEVFLPRKAAKKMNIHRGTDDHPVSIVNDNFNGGLPEEDYYENRDRELYKNKKG